MMQKKFMSPQNIDQTFRELIEAVRALEGEGAEVGAAEVDRLEALFARLVNTTAEAEGFEAYVALIKECQEATARLVQIIDQHMRTAVEDVEKLTHQAKGVTAYTRQKFAGTGV